MEKVLHCDCGFEVHAETEAELVAGVQQHALGVHGMPFSREDVLRLFSRETGGAIARGDTAEKDAS